MADTVSIVAQNCILDGSAQPIATGVWTMYATDQNDVIIPFRFGSGGQATMAGVTRNIAAGSLTGNALTFGNPSTSSPTLYARIVIQDTSSSPTVTTVYRRVQIVPNSSGVWNFADMNTGQYLPGVSVAYVSGPPGLPGSPGEVNLLQISQVRVLTQQPFKNLFDPTRATSGVFVNGQTGVVGAAYPSYVATGAFAANTGGQMVFSQAINGDYNNGVAWYKPDGVTFVSGQIGPIAAGTPVTVPATAAVGRVSADGLAVATFGIYNGTQLPSATPSFDYVPTSVYNAGLAAATAGAAQIPLSVRDIMAFQEAGANVLDDTQTTLGQYVDGSTGVVAPGYPDLILTPPFRVNSGGTMRISFYINAIATQGIAFKDQSGNYVGGLMAQSVSGGITPGTIINVPATAVTGQLSTSSFAGGLFARPMITFGSVQPTAYKDFPKFTYAQRQALAAITPPLAGKRLGCFMDSYGGLFQNSAPRAIAAALSMSLVFADSKSGRQINQIFENYYGSSSTSVNAAHGNTNQSIGPDGTTATMTNGTTLAQDLANVDWLYIALGTNPDFTGSGGVQNLGAPGDPTTALTTYGSIARALTNIYTAKPSIRVLWATPWQFSGTAYSNPVPNTTGIVQAIQYVCNQFGTTVANLYANLPVNPQTWSTYLGSDNIHPSAAGFAMYQTYIQRQLLNQN